MARAELEDRWVAAGDLDAVRRRVVRFLERSGMTITEESDDELQAKEGSQLKTRLFGGWFVSAGTLPKRATITFREVEGGVRVRAVIEESLGFGIMDPVLKDKYERYFEDWLDDLMAAVR